MKAGGECYVSHFQVEGSYRRWRGADRGGRLKVELGHRRWSGVTAGGGELSQVEPTCRVMAVGVQGLLFEESDSSGQERSLVKGG